MLKTTGIEIELVQDKDQLDFAKSGIRGGMCGPFYSRYSRANNPACVDYDPDKPNTWLILLDANNLYGGVMREHLPFGAIEWADVSLEQILSTADDAELGYIAMVDLEYPHELHDSHDDYPMAPEHMKPEFEMLSPYQKAFGKRTASGKKLLQTLYDKTNYVCHYRNLKFYVRHGLKVTALKRVLRFKQKNWMAEYIDINTELRKTATTDCQKDLGKLFNNAVFGKSMEDLLKRVNVKLVSTEYESNQETSKPNFKKFTTFQENLTAITLGRTAITWTKPTYIGMAVLDLSKLVMYEFVYDVIKSQYGDNAKVLYSDTDSLLLQIQTVDLYQDLAANKDHYDFSNYPPEHPLYSKDNEKVVLKMKDELGGNVMLEYVGPKPKMYSMLHVNGVKQSCKGVNRTVRKGLNHELYVEVLEKQLSIRREMNVLRSRGLSIYTEKINKTALCCFDDKRYVTGFQSKAYGHYSIAVPRPKISKDDEVSEDEMSEEDEMVEEDERSDIDEISDDEVLEEDDEECSVYVEDIPPMIDPGYWRTVDVESDEEVIYIPPKKQKKNPFIDYEAEEC